MPLKFYLYIAVVIAFIGNGFYFNHRGYQQKAFEDFEALQEAKEKESKAIKELSDAKSKRDVVYKDRIKVITRFRDDSGCLDNPLPDEFIEQLRNAYNSK